MSIDKAVGAAIEDVSDVVTSFNKTDQVSKRHEVDMLADNKLSKNIRPLVLIWMLILLTAVIVLEFFKITISDKLHDFLFWGNSIILAFYFGGRTLEKYKKTNVKLARDTAKLEEKMNKWDDKRDRKAEKEARREERRNG